jgi:hypothetical protein
MIPSSESTSEDLENQEIPIEFPFQIARSIDEILSINGNSFKTEKPNVEDTATCPNTDINTEATIQEPDKLKKFNSSAKDRKTREDRNVNKADRSESDASVSMSYSEPSISADRKMFKELTKLRKQKMDKYFGINKKITQNEISRSSKESDNLYEETFVLKKVNGKPVKGTLTVEKFNENEAEKTVLIGKEDGTDEEKKNLENMGKMEEIQVPMRSHILDVLMNPFRIF